MVNDTSFLFSLIDCFVVFFGFGTKKMADSASTDFEQAVIIRDF
jgi:hypothetical protein